MRTFSNEHETEKAPESVLREMLAELPSPLAHAGYKLETQSENGLTFSRAYRPWFIWVLVVITFPIGLLFLLYKDAVPISIVLEPQNSGTLIRVNGQGSPSVERSFEQMQI